MSVKPISFLFFCGLAFTSNAQYLKVDNAVQFSSFSNKIDLPVLRSRIATYAIQVGVDYVKRNWFFLSSQVGYARIGGREKNPFLLQPDYQYIEESKGYLNINTTIRPYLRKGNSILFLGIGPTVNLLTGGKKFESSIYEGYSYPTLRVGGKAEVGILEAIGRFQFGLVGAYLRDVTPAAKTEFLSLYSSGFTLQSTIGYRLN
jgi:hypothetical protein